MGSLTTTAERIIRQPALTMPGNATGAEAACTSLTASQIRTLLSLGTADSPSFSGMTLSGHLLFNATNTYDIGNGTYDPRTVRAATSVLTPLVNNASAALTLGNATYGIKSLGAIAVCDESSGAVRATISIGAGSDDRLILDTAGSGNGHVLKMNNVEVFSTAWPGASATFHPTVTVNAATLVNPTAALTLGNSTYGVTVPGAAVVTGDISMQKATQGYIRAFEPASVKSTAMYHDGTNGILSTSSGPLLLQASAQEVHVYNPGATALFVVYDSTKTGSIGQYHNGTSGVIATNSGPLVLDPVTSCQVLSSTHIQDAAGSAEHYIRCSTPSGYSALYLDETTGSGTLTRFNSAWSVVARRGVTRLSATNGVEFGAGNGRYYFGAIDSTRPSITATSTTAAFRLGDDSADAPISCAGITASGILSLTSNYQTLSDGVNLVFGTTTGSMIGTSATQKLSLWGVTPVIQPASANQAALSLDVDVTGADTVDLSAVNANFTSIQTLVNQLRSDLVAAGLIKGAA